MQDLVFFRSPAFLSRIMIAARAQGIRCRCQPGRTSWLTTFLFSDAPTPSHINIPQSSGSRLRQSVRSYGELFRRLY